MGQAILHRRKFEPEHELLAVFGSVDGHDTIDFVSGIYYQLAYSFNGRPCYQRVVKRSPAVHAQLLCGREHMFWSELRQGWKLGVLEDDAAALAYSCEAATNPL